MADRLSEEDEATFRTLAMIERTTAAEQRRRALHAHAKRARRSKNVAELVGHILAAKECREREDRSNVIPLRRDRG